MTDETSPAATLHDTKRRLAILRQLARGTSLRQTVAVTGCTLADARGLADEYGWPNDLPAMSAAVRHLEENVAVLEREVRAAHGRGPVALVTGTPATSGVPVTDGAGRDREYVDVRLTSLTDDPAQARDHLTGVADLAASMRDTGLVLPVVARHVPGGAGRPARLVLVDGHRRVAAARTLGWPTIPAVVRRQMDDGTALTAAFVANTQREALDPIEEASALQRISRDRRLGSAREIAAAVGRSQTWVSDRLALLALPDTDQDAVRRGALTVSAAVKAARRAAGTEGTPRGPRGPLPPRQRAATPRAEASPAAGTAGSAGSLTVEAPEDWPASPAPLAGACPTCGAVQAPVLTAAAAAHLAAGLPPAAPGAAS